MKLVALSQSPKSDPGPFQIRKAASPHGGGAVTINLEEATELYDEAISLIKSILNKAAKHLPIEGRQIADLVRRLCENITLGDGGIVYLSNRSTPRNYLYSQSVNVCILSILVGAGLGYDAERLHELGVAALLHDIGMVKVMEIAQMPRRLTEAEYAEVKKHTLYGAEILQEVSNLSESAIFVCKTHHAHRRGEAKPTDLPDQIREYAQIVGLVDIYAAMTQPRPYREAKLSHDAVRELIGEAGVDLFDARVMKTLVGQIGVYPIGSWVRLNTNEVGRVYARTPEFPLRPVVEVLFDAKNRPLAEPKMYDLCRKQILYIKEPVDLNRFRLETP